MNMNLSANPVQDVVLGPCVRCEVVPIKWISLASILFADSTTCQPAASQKCNLFQCNNIHLDMPRKSATQTKLTTLATIMMIASSSEKMLCEI